MTQQEKQELRRLYPELSDEELEEANYWLTRYAELLVRMVERRAAESEDSESENHEV